MRAVLRIIPPDRRFVLPAVIPAEDQVRIVESIRRLDVAGWRVERPALAISIELDGVPSAGWRIREIPDRASSPKTYSFPSRSGGSTKAHVQLFGAALGLELLRWFFDDAVVWRR